MYAGSAVQMQAVLEMTIGQCDDIRKDTFLEFRDVQRTLGDDLVTSMCKLAEVHRRAGNSDPSAPGEYPWEI